MNKFLEMGLSQMLIDSLDEMSIFVPTHIQAEAIPLALQEKDLLGSAQTGTGKTLAFVLPLIQKLQNNPEMHGLILTPTRELAQQIFVVINKLVAKERALKAVLLIGGESIVKQFKDLKAQPRIFIGTPGRIIDHLERKSFNPAAIRCVVLDETDRMLDMGFGIQLDNIIKRLPEKRQTMMFSATLPGNIVHLAKKYLHNPTRVSVGSITKPSDMIKQEIIHVSETEKYSNLLTQLQEREGTIIVFVKTKSSAQNLAHKLFREERHNTCAIHGDLRQNKRERVINAFRKGRHRIMVATDIAARGLDIPHIQHVINYDLPQCPEDYIHRIGRTARGEGNQGFALCMITPREMQKWRAIDRMLNSSQTQSQNIMGHKKLDKKLGAYKYVDNSVKKKSRVPFEYKKKKFFKKKYQNISSKKNFSRLHISQVG